MVQVPCKFKAVYLILLHSLYSHHALCNTQHHIFSSFKKKIPRYFTLLFENSFSSLFMAKKKRKRKIYRLCIKPMPTLKFFATKLGTWKLFVEGLFNCILFIFHVFSYSVTWRVECLRKIVFALKSVALTFLPFIHLLKVIEHLFIPSELAGRMCLLWRKD